MLGGLALSESVGAEIGPLDKALALKSQGTVYYVDHCDTESLKARWASDPAVDTAALHVDAVWGADSLKAALSKACGKDRAWVGMDYILASHVVEHVPDLVSWLREVQETLKSEGVLRLAVPDKRFTFDYLRTVTHLSEVADAFVRKRRTPSGSRVLDFTLNMVHVDCGQAWKGTIDRQALQRGFSDEAALSLAHDAEENGTYHDVHCWVFTPGSFAQLMLAMSDCGLLELACEWLVPTAKDTFEFFVSLRPGRGPDDVRASWAAALRSLEEPASGLGKRNVDSSASAEATRRAANTVTAVVVTFQPDPWAFRQLLERLADEVDAIVVVDNGSAQALPEPNSRLRCIKLARNAGLGAAQNIGIRAASEQGARFVLLLDQDSLPLPGMLNALVEAYDSATQAGCKVGAVGPRVSDASGNDDGFVRFRSGRYEVVPTAQQDLWIDCDMVIASGSLIPVAALDKVGGMAEDLFIDKVDTEWCLRAAAHGYRLIGAPKARLQHRLGERAARIWLFRWRHLRVHKPFRYYYMVRNGLLLRRSPHRTPAWCRADLRQLLSIFVYFGLLMPQGGASLLMMLRGLFDGYRNVSGPMR